MEQKLRVARNRRHRSAPRYKGVAKVTTRRARKGFQLRYNPDFHWSNALYRGLDYIQHTDGMEIINVNRDDASGFRLDTPTTHKQYPSPSLSDSNIVLTQIMSPGIPVCYKPLHIISQELILHLKYVPES